MPMTERHTWSDVRSSFREDQRQAIVLAALELLMEGGSADLSMSMVAERSGISRQTLYRYFPDLNSILAASTEGLASADEALRAWVLAADSPHAQLHRFVDGLIDAAKQHHGSIEEFLAALPPEAREGVRAHHTRTVALLAEILTAVGSDPTSAYAGDPGSDSPLLLGLISAADASSRERVHQLMRQLTE